jgi:ArsR family transcriptional regulator, arsenate/arsenite/antimonite-responsive transcriptional repressor
MPSRNMESRPRNTICDVPPIEPPPRSRNIKMLLQAPMLSRGLDGDQNVNHSRNMDLSRAVTVMSALAQPTRLRTWRMLVEAGVEGVGSGAIAAAVGAPHNTMSSHLTILTHAGLVQREQIGRSVTYRAVLNEVAMLGKFLVPQVP